MISRRKILSRSLDNLDDISRTGEEEDVWYDKDKLCRDHIQEVLDKWTQIDDEIWAKIIVFERNRRVAKAYARSPVITINGSKHGFDGMRIGLNGFDNPMRDTKTAEVKKLIGEGFKMKMDETGNILVKRYGKSNVLVQNTLQNANDETVIGADIAKLPNHALQVGKSGKLFDIKKFNLNINRELGRSYPDRRRLERQCLSAVALVKSSDNLLNCPLWILVINVVAIDMLKNKMSAIPKMFDSDNNNRSPPSSSNEDPYSTIDSQAELTELHPAVIQAASKLSTPKYEEVPYEPKPDYEALENDKALKPVRFASKDKNGNKPKQRKKQDDPYYCGLLARIPNFIKSSKPNKKCSSNKEAKMARKISAQYTSQPIPIASVHQYPYSPVYPYKMYPHHHPLSQSQFSLWDARSLISGVD
ncbi:unnamed protein product [Hermetia illucens]|uniref:MH2 domain-containing protein n=1 Tax=Hermetia illucens TaxID=343691 RepID=A0A7R8UAC0_HERIL|nr:uncharacterized protein LOC119646328 [Hermetia illucens]CAD7077099.1 unnamed protein product [Hermetia illucens]